MEAAGEMVDDATVLIIQSVSAHVDLNQAQRRLQAIARLLICATFLEDSLRMVTSFQTQVATISMVVRAGFLPISVGEAWAVVAFSALLQSSAAVAILLEKKELAGCIALIVWCCVHPTIYAQLGNGEFVSETISVIGGLCILLSHLKEMRAARREILGTTGPAQLPGEPASDWLCLIGRSLLCSYFIYYFGAKMGAIFGGELKFHSAVVEIILMMVLIYMCLLIVVGSRSRRVALGLAVVMLVGNFVFHPFWYFWFLGHEFVSVAQLREISTRLPVDVSLLGDTTGTASMFALYDHERYFFFQRLSTVGALVLLAVYGPGRHSVDEPSAPMHHEKFTGKGKD
ncbi:SURF4 family-domain-containing protein [Pavlovales sp. CCMP2436]|nr:SURF4 family-domain-containing protein [Pavlovales sp. CCMP2436]|mmetsp:Transcript_13353/g.33990  ORF Transcript_13353/g.33990 Transcript_13353/m.33990 type:complete len:343 (-) Transcript_13353:134-1162(-)